MVTNPLGEVERSIPIDDFRQFRREERQLDVSEWYGPAGVIVVHFDSDQRVDWKRFYRVSREGESLLAVLLRWLGL